MVFTKESFEEMIAKLDKDGDGTVDAREFYSEYSVMFPDIGDFDGEGYKALWAEIDTDGSGDVTVEELAAFYGFDLATETANDMSDEKILEALALQAQLDMLNAEAQRKKNAPETAPRRTVTIDKTIKIIQLETQTNPKPEDELQHEFLSCCHTGDFTSALNKSANAYQFVDPDSPNPIDVRIQDEKGETPLHKLARFAGERHTGPPSGGGGELAKLFHQVVRLLREQAKAAGRPGIASEINHQSKDGKTPLFIAVEKQNEKMIELLYSLGRDGPDSLLVNSTGWTVMHAAVHTDCLPILQQLVSKFTTARLKVLLRTPDKTGREPLHIAAFKCSEEMSGFLVDLGAKDETEDMAGNLPSELAEQCFKNTGDHTRRKSKEIIEQKIMAREGRNSKEFVESGAGGRRKSRESREIPSM
mmetsp:Transcript_29253/g.75388  ORF Transcript_29253/g.75388 Transcript_29253/m.75388 type:complete len:417 (+) Transcript_29253:144-1394(+)|eukprot:CAMPEP_0115845850 /NCGR_PEP_ID=MMETSP0287-20121206/9565_1 /TAXON_ID=412157 /ORGANISM="Chrysochromulina rotalis, Strain UIO044" /LENGTH=416 /DNA_ID=CAMNT_0003299637 /DNA_START=216 /DNA_END=1466 /DNA_ORIENTATION=+